MTIQMDVNEFQTREGPKYFVSRFRLEKRKKGFLFKKEVEEAVKDILMEDRYNGKLFFLEEKYIPYVKYATVAHFLSNKDAEDCGKRVVN